MFRTTHVCLVDLATTGVAPSGTGPRLSWSVVDGQLTSAWVCPAAVFTGRNPAVTESDPCVSR